MFYGTTQVDWVSAGRFTIPVLYLDNHLLVVEKPPNLPVQRDASGDDDLLSLMKGYIGRVYHKPGAVYLGLCHRLDRPVGGVVALARTSKAAARLSAAFAQRQVSKSYLAVVEGALSERLELTDYLIKDERSGMVSVVDPSVPGAKEARLITQPVATCQGLTLVSVTLLTGRAHQIRVQHRAAGHPLWGDARYGSGRPGQQIALWAHELGLTHPTRREALVFRSLPPQEGAWTQFSDLLGWAVRPD